MASGRCNRVSARTVLSEEMKAGGVAENGKICDDSPVSEVDAAGLDVVESARVSLRKRWELASVINFLNVFGPVLGDDLNMSAVEIETGLIHPDEALRKLHVTLLKGIPPTSKYLNDSDSWVIVLCKKLKEWWCWVAEGDLPLYPSNGEEIHRYKELDPVTRLLILKALCELRADQDDAVLYINDALKHGTEVSLFRKNCVGKDARGATYWCDNDAAGFRLYKEVMKKDTGRKLQENGFWRKPNFTLQWETVATNLEEFRKIVDDFSSSKSAFEVFIGRTIENDALSVLEKIEKRKERALKEQQRKAMLMNNYRNSYLIGTTRSCRIHKPVTYTFDDYDKAIDEAIHITKQRKVINENRDGGKLNDNEPEKGGGSNSGSSSSDTDSLSDNYSAEGKDKFESSQNNTEGFVTHTESNETDEEYDGDENAGESMNGDDSCHAEEIVNAKVKKLPSHKQDEYTYKHFGSRWSNRLAKTNGQLVSQPLNATTITLPQRATRTRVVDYEDEEMHKRMKVE